MPIRGPDLAQLGCKGKEIGETMAHLEQIWAESRFTLLKEELIAEANKYIKSTKL
jgi:hypothetical protein